MHIQVINSRASSDGAGVKLQRIHGFRDNSLDPFLMLDEINSDNPDDYIAGFPPHPHRGLETLTYIRAGVLSIRIIWAMKVALVRAKPSGCRPVKGSFTARNR
nr:pirin family protein [Aliamphritea spongicola]